MYVEMEMKDEDYAAGIEKQKEIDELWMNPPAVVRRSRTPQFAVGVGPQRYQRHPPEWFDKLPWEEEIDPFKMSVAEKAGWCVLFGMMAFGLLWGA